MTDHNDPEPTPLGDLKADQTLLQDGHSPTGTAPIKPAKKGLIRVIFTVVIVLALLLGGAFVGLRLYESSAAGKIQASLDSQQWSQAETQCDQMLKLESTGLMQDPTALKMMRAEARYRQGKDELALADLQAVEHLLPGDLRPYRYQAEIFLKQGNLDEALAAADELKELDPQSGLMEAIAAYQAYRKNQFAEALAAADQAIQLEPSIALAYRVRGGVRLLNNDFKGAAADLDRALEIEPDQSEALGLHAFAMLVNYEPDRLRQDSERLKIIAPNSVDDLFAQTMVQLKDGQYDEANQLISKAIENSPDFPLYYTIRSTTHFRMGDLQKKLDDLDKATALYPDYPDAIAQKSTALFALYKEVDMLAQAKRVLELDPEGKEGHQMFALYYARDLDYEKAEAEVTGLIEADPNDYEGYLARGSIYLDQAKYDEALKEFQKAIELEPESGVGQISLARFYLMRNQDEEALQAAEKAQELMPDSCEPHVVKAMVLMDREEKENALKSMEEAFKLDPDCLDALTARVFFSLEEKDPMKAMADVDRLSAMMPEHPAWMVLRAKVYLANQDPDKAMTELEKADKINFKISDTFLVRSVAYRMKEEYDKSNDVLIRGTHFFPWNASIHAALADTSWIMGDNQRAIDEGKKALELDDQLYQAYISIGSAYWDEGDIESAIDSITKLQEFEEDLDVTLLDGMEKTLVFLKGIPKAVDGKRTVQNADFKFQLTYSTDWVPTEVDNTSGALYKIEHKDANGAVEVQVIADHFDEPVPTGLGTVGALADLTKAALMEAANFRFVSRSVVNTVNTQGYADTFIIESTDERGGKSSTKLKHYYFVSGKSFIAIVSSAPTVWFERYEEMVDEMASTFSFFQ